MWIPSTHRKTWVWSHVPVSPQLWEAETGGCLVRAGGQPRPDSVEKPCLMWKVIKQDTGPSSLASVHTPLPQIYSVISTSFNSIIFLITANGAQSIESMRGESHGGGPEKGPAALEGKRRGNTPEQRCRGQAGLRGGVQEIEQKVGRSLDRQQTHFASTLQSGR